MFPVTQASRRRPSLFAFVLVLLLFLFVPSDQLLGFEASQPLGPGRRVRAELGRSFEPNLGQTDARVRFLSRGPGYTLYLTEDGAVVALEPRRAGSPPHFQPQLPSWVNLTLRGASGVAEVKGLEELPGITNYLIGNDPRKWHTNVPSYARVRYEEVYPGVDLVYYGGQGGQLECDFVVAPGADPGRISLAVAGQRQRDGRGQQLTAGAAPSSLPSTLRVAANGDLVVSLGAVEVQLHKPVVYQKEFGSGRRQSTVSPSHLSERRRLIEAGYVIKPNGEVRFKIAPYDKRLPLIIDPAISYSTYLGGSDMDYGNAIAVDASGNAYITGYTASTNFPVLNAAQSSPGGGTCSDGEEAVACFDAFVTRLNSSGTAVLYSTYVGGSNEDYGASIAVDGSGDAYVAGYTNSTNFPVHGAIQPQNAGGWDAFVLELGPTGSLIYSTYWGGSADDIGTGIALDSAGGAYLSGYTDSANFPITSGAVQTTYGGGTHNAFAVKFNSGGGSLGYSTFLGGGGDDYAYGVAVDEKGDAYLGGATNSTNFPTLNAVQATYAGGLCAVAPNTFPCYDAFVSKLNPTGTALLFSTYFGGTGSDYGYAIALDASANAYVTGYTTSTDLPTTAGALERTFGGSYDAFVAKLNAAGSTLAYATYLGGQGTQVAYGIAVDSTGSAFVTGYNYGGYLPTANPVQAENADYYDAFLSVLGPTGSALIFSTYLGGSQDDFGRGVAVDSSGNAYVTGATFSVDFPTTSGSFQPTYQGGPYDAFVTKYTVPQVPLAALSPSSYVFGFPGFR